MVNANSRNKAATNYQKLQFAISEPETVNFDLKSLMGAGTATNVITMIVETRLMFLKQDFKNIPILAYKYAFDYVHLSSH